MPIKTCPKCKKSHPATSEFFHKDPSKSGGLESWCRECKNSARRCANPILNREKVVDWKKRNPEKTRLQKRKRRLKVNFGLTLEQYDQMYEAQGGVCAACGGINPDDKRLAVDHNHKTGKVRGLLCSNCNLAIGNLKESPELFIKVLHYLIKRR